MEIWEVVFWCIAIPLCVMTATYFSLKDAKFEHINLPEDPSKKNN